MKIPITIVILFYTNFSYGTDTNNEINVKQEEINELSENITSRQAGQIRFEGQETYSQINNDLDTRVPSHSFKFEEDSIDNGIRSPGRITFQDDNRIPNTGGKKRKRRRRKPRYQRLPNPNTPGLYPVGLQYPPGFGPLGPQYPGLPGAVQPFPGLGQGGGPQYPGLPSAIPPYPGLGQVGGPTGPNNRPPRRQKPTFASEALTAVTGALTSIALYDDYQCVPRLLCEAAGGGALGTTGGEALGSSGVLKAVAGLQPLLTLLSAYNGVSTSPLFVFGRAVFLGMTSKGNTASCRYAYPQCPSDPEQLIHYLNNHNGGFFRFFNNPQLQDPQNLEQFYHQLSQQGQNGLQQQNLQQNYGLYNPQSAQQQQNTQNLNQFQSNFQYEQQPNLQQGLYHQHSQHAYGLQPYPGGQQNYGLYSSQSNRYPQPQQNDLHNQQFQNNGPQNPDFNHGYGFQNYGPNYPYNNQYGQNTFRFRDRSNTNSEKIQRRIQNRPNSSYYVDTKYVDSTRSKQKLKFPESGKEDFVNEEIVSEEDDNLEAVRGGKALKFPEERLTFNSQNKNNDRKVKSITFPEPKEVPNVNENINQNHFFNENNGFDYQNSVVRDVALNNYIRYFSYYHGNAVNTNINDDGGTQTVYIVRGDGDPNMPEIFNLRPGERVV